LAVLLNLYKEAILFFCKRIKPYILVGTFVLIYIINAIFPITVLSNVIFNDIIGIIFCITIVNFLYTYRFPDNIFIKALNSLGKVSFGLYLFHILVLNCMFFLFPHMHLFILSTIAFLLTIFISYISYEFFEKKILAYKSRFEK
jgi:peptidoglycan/LPS O-acetylase OafA/YrhL